MENEAAKNAYDRRIAKVCDYIQTHLDEALSLDRLSQMAHFSKFHFHRQFAEYVGVNLYKFVQLQRFKRASYRLAFHKQDKIIDIALEAGFENPESFSRAFKQTFGQTPTQFRKHPDWAKWNGQYNFHYVERKPSMQVDIVQFDTTKIAVLEHRGPKEKLNNSVALFIQWRKQSRLSPVRTSRTLGIAYDDPETTDPDKFRFDICGSVDDDVPANDFGVVTKSIPGGRCALLRHSGSRDAIGTSVHYLYGQWLPASGEELRDFPCFFHYLNLFPEVPEHQLQTDIYLPLR